jgi:hypothetical protein
MSYYYLYLIKFEDGRFYIGSRKSKVPAEKDVKYWGSPGKINEHLWEMKKEKHILFESTDISLQDLRKKEYEFIQSGWNKFGKDKCVNKSLGGLDSITEEVMREIGRQNGLRSLNNKTGVFSQTKEQLREVGLRQVINKTGFHGASKKQKQEWGKSGGYIGGQKSYEMGVGVHGLSFDQKSKIGKTNYAQGKGIGGMSKEELQRASAKAKQIQKERGTGIYSISIEDRIKTATKTYHSGKGIGGASSKQLSEWGKRGGIHNAKRFSVKSPTGEIYVGRHLANFCEQFFDSKHGAIKYLGEVINGKRESYKGWTRVEETE